MTIDTKFIDERVNYYLELLDFIRGRVGDDQLAMALLEQCGRDWRTAQMRQGDRRSDHGASRGDWPATPAQRAFLDRLQVKYIPQNLSKAQASRMIDEVREMAV